MQYRFHEDMGEELRDQLADLSHEVAALKKQMARRGKGAYRQTRHLGEDAAEWIRDTAGSTLPEIRRSAHHLQKSAKEHPATTAGITAASVIVLGLALALLMRR